HQRLARFGDEGSRRAGIRERVGPRPCRFGARHADGIDLRLDDARIAVLDRPHHRDGPSVPASMANEKLLPCRQRPGGLLARALAHWPEPPQADAPRSTAIASARAPSVDIRCWNAARSGLLPARTSAISERDPATACS